MKKLLFLALLFAGSLSAQQWNLTLGNESKELKMKRNDVQHLLYIGGNSQQFYLLRHDVKEDYDYLVAYNFNLEEQHRVRIESGKHISYVGGFLNGDVVSLMGFTQQGNSFKAFRERYDAATLKSTEGRTELYNLNHRDAGKLSTTMRSSQSGEWLAAFYVLPTNNDAEARVSLYDTELDEMWNMDVTLSALDDYYVSDSGEVILAVFYNATKDQDGSLTFTVLDGEREQSYTTGDIADSIYSIDIVKCSGDIIYCTGLLRGERQDNKDDWVSGFFSLAYDRKSKTLSHYEKHLFSKTDICRLCNVGERASLPKLSVDKMSFAASRALSNGSLVVYERFYNLYVNGAYMQSERGGLLCLRIDDQGHITASNITRRQLNYYNELRGSAFTTIVESQGVPYIATIDNAKNSDAQISRPFKSADAARSSSSLLMLHFGDNGDFQRQYLQRPSSCINLSRPVLLDDGSYLMLFGSDFNSFAGKLKLAR